MKLKLILPFVALTIQASAQNPIFNGGNGDGYARNDFAEVAGNIFNGGNGDGWATAVSLVNLPVRFTYFKAEPSGTTALLLWETSSEQDAEKFEVERSEDGLNFQLIGQRAATNTNGTVAYRFTDNRPLAGPNYYRLKQVDRNGSFVYTPVRMIAFGKMPPSSIIVYPQPASQYVRLKLPPELDGKNVVLNVINSAGSLEKQVRISLNRGSNLYTLPVSKLAKGIYFLHLGCSDKMYISQLVIE